MSLKTRGKSTSASEVTNICRDGFWVLLGDREFYVPFADYPAFRKAPVKDIYAMEEIAPGHLRWESLDCDVEVEALESPEKFPLVFRK